MQQQTEMPKTYKERLDELAVGGYVPLETDEERDKFNSTRYREFHNVDDCDKVFVIRTDKRTGEKRMWRIQ